MSPLRWPFWAPPPQAGVDDWWRVFHPPEDADAAVWRFVEPEDEHKAEDEE